jgi:hypothetical protein
MCRVSNRGAICCSSADSAHAPNEDAVLYFAGEIFPKIRAQLSGVRFIIVGSHVPPAVCPARLR